MITNLHVCGPSFQALPHVLHQPLVAVGVEIVAEDFADLAAGDGEGAHARACVEEDGGGRHHPDDTVVLRAQPGVPVHRGEVEPELVL